MLAAQIGFRLACSHTADSAREVLDKVTVMLGSVAIFETTIIERCQRDVLAAAKHIAMSPSNDILAGRADLGLDLGRKF